MLVVPPPTPAPDPRPAAPPGPVSASAPGRAQQTARHSARGSAQDTGQETGQETARGTGQETGQGTVPDAVQGIVERELSRLFRQAVGVRLMLSPLLVVGAVTVAWLDPDPWRRGLVGLVALLAIPAAALTELRARASGIGVLSVPANLLGMATLQLVMITATGGVLSPLLPLLVPMALVVAVSMGRRPATLAVLGLQVLTILVLTTIQALGLLPGLPLHVLRAATPLPPGQALLAGTVIIAVISLGGAVGMLLRQRFEAVIAAALAANQEQLQTWVAWSRELEALGGEIAHELKNPLASIKGLGALVARDLPEGRARSRMDVLQGEAGRMQEILEGFLTFSRPISPLALAPVLPRELCLRVVDLHEGMARAAGVGMSVAGDTRPLQGDARKLVQVLVNLVQNALAVAPRGSVVELRLSEEEAAGEGQPAAAIIEVADRGPGLPPQLSGRLFEAGVSTRPEGGGLGLTIALGIVRQHGGELSLEDRPGGGAVARVRLPRPTVEIAAEIAAETPASAPRSKA